MKIVIFISILLGCWRSEASAQETSYLYPEGNTVQTRIPLPEGYRRDSLRAESFGAFLRNFPLEPHGAKVYFYNGTEKPKTVHVAVLKADVGKRDLQQCADAVIRLRAEYLYGQKRYDELHFNFTNGFRADYRKWADGNRIKVDGNRVSWYKAAEKDYSYRNFRAWLDCVFAYAGTLSLSKELQSVPYSSLQAGDVLIQGGSPGHAVIVMDVAAGPHGKKLYLLAQSYMPAQSIHILKNPLSPSLSPWYELSGEGAIPTPEWVFTSSDLKRFR